MRIPTGRKSPANAAGFTLLELLVSAAMIGVIMMIMLTATSTSMAIWRNSERAIAVDREARNAMSLIADDFSNMLPVATNAPSHLQPVFYTDAEEVPGGDQPDGQGQVFIEALVLRPRDYQANGSGNNGDLCYVRYRYRNEKIERAVADSKATYDALRDGKTPITDNYEVLSDNAPKLFVFPYQANGKEARSGEPVVFYSLAIKSLEEDEARNLEKGIELKERGTSSELLSSMQYFSAFYEVPRPN